MGQAIVFPVVMYGCESWTIKKTEHWRTDAFELWCWRRLLRVPWIARRSNQSILKEVSPEYSLEELMLKLKLQYFVHLMRRTDSLEKTLMLGKTECRRRRRATEDGDSWMFLGTDVTVQSLISPHISVQSVSQLSCVRLFETPWTPAHQTSLSITNSRSLLKLITVESVCHPNISSSIIPFSSAFNLSQHQGLFKWVSSSHQVAKVLELQLQSFQWIIRTDFL